MTLVLTISTTVYAATTSGSFRSNDNQTTANYFSNVNWNLISADVAGGFTEIDADSADFSRTAFLSILSYKNNSLGNSYSGNDGYYTIHELKQSSATKFIFYHQIMASDKSTPVATRQSKTYTN